jgi:hypothetical protein
LNLSLDELNQLRAYLGASQELEGWIRGARAFALLQCAVESGILSALSEVRTPDQIAAVTDTDPGRAGDLCQALEEFGIVVSEGSGYWLAPASARLNSPDAAGPLPTVIRQSAVMLRTLQAAAAPDSTYITLPSEDVLAMAEGAGVSAMSSSPHVSIEVIARLMP